MPIMMINEISIKIEPSRYSTLASSSTEASDLQKDGDISKNLTYNVAKI